MPLGSSSAAPVMRPGPNCLTRGSSVMLFSSLTIAMLQQCTWSPEREQRWKSEDQDRRKLEDRSSHLRLSAFGRTALRGMDLKRHRAKAGAAHAALTTTYTTTHKDDLFHQNSRDDRPEPCMCKAINGERPNAEMANAPASRNAFFSAGAGGRCRSSPRPPPLPLPPPR